MMLAWPAPSHAAEPLGGLDWNGDQIEWHAYAAGMARAKETGKQAVVVIHTTWCPYCAKYQSVFHDAKIVEAAQKFVMILIDRDREKDLNKRLGPGDQTGIPRTIFLKSDGSVRPEIAGKNAEMPNLIDYTSPNELLHLMNKAASTP
ncbi:MAG: thioredoxin family protein [Hyphomicrobiaceae bacterium]